MRTAVAALLLAGMAQTVPSGENTEQQPLTSRIERAVVVGSVETLREIRTTLLDRLDAADGEPAHSDRYMVAYVNWRITQWLDQKQGKERKKLLKEAQAHLQSVLKVEPGNAEAYALRGTVIGERIGGFFGGMFLGPKAGSSLKRAFALEGENPRVALQRGIGFFYTPKTFGGGLLNAEAELQRARDLFAGEDPEADWPNWGRIDTLAWLGIVLAKQDRIEAARKMFDEALAREPEHQWVRNELLPGLETYGSDLPIPGT